MLTQNKNAGQRREKKPKNALRARVGTTILVQAHRANNFYRNASLAFSGEQVDGGEHARPRLALISGANGSYCC